MEFVVSDLGVRRKEVSVTIPSETVNIEFGNAYAEVSRHVAFPGFRKGKVPTKVIEKRFGAEVKNDVCERLVGNALRDVVSKEELPIVGQPEFDLKAEDLKAGDGFAFKIKVDLKPTIEIPDYKGIKVEKEKVEIASEDVDSAIENLRQRYAKELDVTEGEIADGDNCMANCVLTVDGEEVDTRDDVYIAPQAGFIFGTQAEKLDETLKGVKIGDSVDVEVTLPDTYKTEELRGKTGTVKATIKALKRRELPEVNDKFAEDMGLEDVEELREEIEKSLKTEADNRATADARKQLTDALVEKTNIEVSENMVARYKEFVIQRQRNQLMQMGLNAEQLDGHNDEFEAGAEDAAKRELTLDSLLEEIGDAEKVYATEREVNEAIAAESQQQQMTPEQMREMLEKRGIMDSFRSDLRKQKVIDALMEKAEVVEVEPKKDEKSDD